MRGHIRVVCVQADGAACAVSPELQCRTRGSRWDFIAGNMGFSNFSVSFPSVVGQHPAYPHIYPSQGDDPVPLVGQWIHDLQEGQRVYEEIKPYVEALAKLVATTQGAG